MVFTMTCQFSKLKKRSNAFAREIRTTSPSSRQSQRFAPSETPNEAIHDTPLFRHRCLQMISLKDVLILVHVFSMLSWLGAMYFNLTLLFPMYKSRPRNSYAELMQEQGTRAAPLLYLLIFLTASSGLAIVLL